MRLKKAGFATFLTKQVKKAMHQSTCLAFNLVKELKLRNRMREFRSYGSVGGALGNRCFYPEVA